MKEGKDEEKKASEKFNKNTTAINWMTPGQAQVRTNEIKVSKQFQMLRSRLSII